MKLLYYIRPMKDKSIYLLLYNGVVEQASRDLKNLHTILCLMCQRASVELPLSYVQVTRNMAVNTSFIHLPSQLHKWEIISRKLLFTRRTGRKSPGSTILNAVAQEGENGRGAASSA